MCAFSGVEQRVRVNIAYARVFDDALTESELIEVCGPGNAEEVRRCLRNLEDSGTIRCLGGSWILNDGGWEKSAEAAVGRRRLEPDVLDANARVLRRIAWLPWIRLMAVSGSAARRRPRVVHGAPADIDLFIIASPGSVHLVRFVIRSASMLRSALMRVVLSSPPARLCPNYVTEASMLEVDYKSFFVANDALNVHVLKGPGEYRRFLAANRWIARYFPLDVEVGDPGPVAHSSSLPLAALNLVCFLLMGFVHGIKMLLQGRRPIYALRPRPNVSHTLRRVAPSGGGYQPQVAERFSRVYGAHFGADPKLERFLFPDTTAAGVYVDGELHPTPSHVTSMFDE